MGEQVVRVSERRETTTPNGVMSTMASPTLGGSELSLWSVRMVAGARGPVHVFSSGQLWNLVEGAARLEIGDTSMTLAPGDTAVLPGGVARQIHALEDLRAVVCGFGNATASVPGEDTSRGTPPWIG